MMRPLGLAAAVLWAGSLAACGPTVLRLPDGPGEPFPGFEASFADATSACRAVRTLTAEIGLSGRAGGQKIRGRATIGLAAPAGIRLEGLAPFGPPVFILAADARESVLLLPRDHRVLAGAAPGAILDALIGLDLDPADLLAILAGCVTPEPRVVSGRAFPGGWARVELERGGSLFLQRAGDRWQVRSGARPPLRVDYERSDRALTVRIASVAENGAATDLTLALSQVETNGSLGPEVFAVRRPADAEPISLGDLRRAGPLGDRR